MKEMPYLEEKMRKRTDFQKGRCQQISVGTRILISGPRYFYYPKAPMPMSGRAALLSDCYKKQEYDESHR